MTTTTPTNSTNDTSIRPYEEVAIPEWGFECKCNWVTAVRVDLTISSIAILYNFIITLLPFVVSRMYCMQGAVISSYTWAAFLVSIYSAFFDSRLLESGKQQLEDQGNVGYILIWFLNYHCMFHMHLLSWDQHHSVTSFNAHRRFISRSKLIEVEFVVCVIAIAFAALEAFFLYDTRKYEKNHAAFFHLIVVMVFWMFFWFGPLILMLSWNGSVFSFLLKVIHNGTEKKTPPQRVERQELDTLGDIVPNKDEEIDEDPPEFATLPDDINFQITNSFANIIMLTTFAAIMILWSSYHVLAIFRISKALKYYRFYEIIYYRCEIYITLYAVAKFVLLLNPLWCFYYRKEIYNMRRIRRHGTTHE